MNLIFEKKYAVSVSKTIGKEEQEKEQRLLKNRRELLDKGNDLIKLIKSTKMF